jgi:hypothetical protein
MKTVVQWATELRTLSAIAAAEAIIAELDAFRLLMRLRKPHPQQQRGLGPRVKSAFLDTFLFQHGLMASQSIGLHRHGVHRAAAANPQAYFNCGHREQV